MNEMKPIIEQMIAEEYMRANEKYGPHHSLHEGYAVLKEEIEEAVDEMDNVRYLLDDLWGAVKTDAEIDARIDAERIYKAGICLIAEAVQVGAMTQKLKVFIEEKIENEKDVH